jgi:hypothetical protein
MAREALRGSLEMSLKAASDRGETAALVHVVSTAAKRRPDSNSSRCSGFR